MSGLKPLYYEQVLKGMAFSFFGIFVPIFLLTKGYSLSSVFLYFLVHHTTNFIFTPINIAISKKTGYKSLIVLSIVFVILFLFLLQSLNKFAVPIYLIAIVVGLNDAFYFTPLHGYFTRLTKTGERGTKLSNFISVGKFAGLIAPIVGGVIATFFGFNVLFSLSIFFIIISVHPF